MATDAIISLVESPVISHMFSMHTRLLALACLLTATTFAVDAPKLPSLPEQPIAQKKELLFADDFEKAELGEVFESRCVHCVFPRAIQPLQG